MRHGRALHLLVICSLAASCSRVVDRSCEGRDDFCPTGYCCIDDRCEKSPGVSCDLGEWVVIPAGIFMMGSPEDEVGNGDGDGGEIRHEVTLTHAFEMLSIEVTQGDFTDLMGYNHASFSPEGAWEGYCPEDRGTGRACPMETVNWSEAAAFCNVLSARYALAPCYTCTGDGPDVMCAPSVEFQSPYACPGYRLPTEAEWEHAARGGSSDATFGGSFDGCTDEDLITECEEHCARAGEVLDPIAWYCGNAEDTVHGVGLLGPNTFGVYDILGNVSEWCHDWVDDYPEYPQVDPWGRNREDIDYYRDAHVVRGGGVFCTAADQRAAARDSHHETERIEWLGFRPVRTMDE